MVKEEVGDSNNKESKKIEQKDSARGDNIPNKKSESEDYRAEKKAKKISEELDVKRSKIEEKLKNLLEYEVPIEQAEKTIKRSLSSGELGEEKSEKKNIQDIERLEGERATIEGKILRAGKREIGGHEVIEGAIADETGEIGFVDWERRIEEGDEIKIESARVQERKGNIELSLGESTNISSIKLSQEIEKKKKNIKDIDVGDRSINLNIKVVESEKKEINSRNEITVISSGIAGDSTGRIHFTDWSNRLEEGKSYRINNAYVNEFKDIPELNLDEYTEIEEIQEVESTDPPKIEILNAIKKDGAFDVWVEGRILEIREAGIIERCRKCGRILRNGSCKKHGDIQGEKDIRTKAILDDSTGALIIILDKNLTQKILSEKNKDISQNEMQDEKVTEIISNELVGKKFRVRGDIGVGEYGANLNAREIKKSEENVAKEAQKLLDECISVRQ